LDRLLTSKDNDFAGDTIFLPAMERWIEGILSANQDKEPEVIMEIVNTRLRGLMLANYQWHTDMAAYLKDQNLTLQARHHKDMAQIYESLCKKELVTN
jgi:hypothetical protein